MQFARRPDLTPHTRINIIMKGIDSQGQYGEMTKLADSYRISRTFLYEMVNAAKVSLENLFTPESSEARNNIKELRKLDELTLLLRLEGKCSIGSIGYILKSQGYFPSSVGNISERLQEYGEKVPSVISNSSELHVFYLSDEIFATSKPILITIEPKSSAILKIELCNDRRADTWSGHYQDLKNYKIYSVGSCSDRAVGIVKGYHAIFPDSPWYSDHFHEFQDLTKLLYKLEKEAYSAIRHESECFRKLGNAKSVKNIKKRMQDCEESTAICSKKIQIYDEFLILSNLLFSSMNFFDECGHLRLLENVKSEVLAIFEMMGKIDHLAIKEVVNSLKGRIDEIIKCFQEAKDVYENLSALIPDSDVLSCLCLAWQHDHKSYQSKSQMKSYHKKECDFWLSCAEGILQDKFNDQKTLVFDQLDSIIRASSLIEMVNSLIRPYLNSCKGQITQEALNLIMFYHNHHRFKSGKRKGQAPIEILTGKPLEKEWCDLLLEITMKKPDMVVLNKSEGQKRLKLVVNNEVYNKKYRKNKDIAADSVVSKMLDNEHLVEKIA